MASSSSSPSSPSIPASSSRSWKYDVFLSFRGEDTHKTFVGHLYSALVERLIHTYKDNETLPRGDTIGPSLLNAISESQIAIIIFSENYANSSWCLDELTYIMKCREERGLIVLPIFYHVEPTDVRKQKRKYEEAFAKHEFENHNSKVESWRKALIAAGNIAGWEINHKDNGYEAKFIKDVVGSVLDKLLYLKSVVDEKLVGLGTRMQDLKTQLQVGSGGVRMVGIWGIGGGGKTTLASSLYIEISGKFDSCCFLGNIKDESHKPNGMETLQGKILSTVLKKEVKVESVDIGKHTIKSRLRLKNVLLVLDDIDDRKQLEALAGSHDWFGDGSRIIITTRYEHWLRTHRVDEVYQVRLLSKEEADRLFYSRAYNENKPVEDYKRLSQHVISYAAGLPLALIVLGSFLYDKNKEEWISTLDTLKENPEIEIVNILKISYDGLTPLEKELFLDIACFYRRTMLKDEAVEILEACGFHPVRGVKVLIQKGLITINSEGKFDMHDLIQEMGHYIVRGEHPNNPEKHSRLWRRKEIKDICCNGNATTENNRTEAIIISGCPSGFGKFVSKAKKLRLLLVFNERDIEGPDFLSNELRHMYWTSYPASPFPESFQPRKLVVLKIERTLQEELWKGKKHLPCLKELYIRFARNLVRTPDFGGLPSLEKLTLEDCPTLKLVEGNFHALKLLKKCIIRGGYFREPFMQLPKDLFDEHNDLEELYLYDTRQACNFYLPRFITRLSLIRCGMKDEEIPHDIGKLSNLQELDLSRNEFSRLNISLSQLSQLKLLKLSECGNLVELPKLPTSIAILKAYRCHSLDVVVGDIINTNCKWLSQVSLSHARSVIGGVRLLETMLQGNAIENGCMSLRLTGVEIPKKGGFIPRLLKRKERYRLELPDNWYNLFSGFLFCLTGFQQDNWYIYHTIIMEHYENGGLMNSEEEDVYWEETNSEDEDTWVGYVSFGLLKHTTWWDPTSTNIQFTYEDDSSCSGFGVDLVSKTVDQLQTTTDSSSYSDNYKCNFLIKHDSRSCLEVTFG